MPELRLYTPADLADMTAIWNRVVADGVAFPQTEPLSPADAAAFFAAQTASAVAVDDGRVAGLYILHPNNVGRCGHIANASYAVAPGARGHGVGESLVRHSLTAARARGFRLMQFNAVVADNHAALAVYEKVGFRRIGVEPGGFRLPNGRYEDIVLLYYDLTLPD